MTEEDEEEEEDDGDVDDESDTNDDDELDTDMIDDRDSPDDVSTTLLLNWKDDSQSPKIKRWPPNCLSNFGLANFY